MLTLLRSRLKRAGKLLPVALLPFAAHAQFNYAGGNATNVAGAYTDLGTTGTAIATANTDDANSAAQPIGFTFTYNGTAFTQFVLNTNGFIKLGATAPSAADLFLPENINATQTDPFESTNAADVNIIAPFNFDLIAGSAAGATEYRVTTTGTSPNRVCTVQWKNVADRTLDYDQQYGSMNFQAKLYETSNLIEFVYGPTVQGTLPDDYRFGVVGIKGSTTNASVMATKGGTGITAWSTATFINGFYTTDALNYRGTVPPDAGRTYRFAIGTAPTVANDDPAGAIALTIGTTCSPVNGTNANSTTTAPNGYANGTNPNTACGIAVNPKDVWYKFTTTASGPGSTAVKITVAGAPAGYLRLFSSTGGAAGPFTEIACASGGTNNVVSTPLAVTSLAPNTTYYLFVAGFGSGDTTGPFTICATSTPANDAAVTAIYTLGTASSTFGSPVAAQAVISNPGGGAQANLVVTLAVSGATTYTTTQTIASLAPGASTIVNFSIPLTATTGTNTLTVTIPTDADVTNNTKSTTQTVSATTQSHFLAGTTTYDGGFGSNTVANVALLVRYKANAGSAVQSVIPTFLGTTSSTYQILIYGAAATTGLPGTLLYTSPTLTRPNKDGAVTVAVPTVPVSGEYFVGVKQLTTTNIGLAAVITNPLRPATFYFYNGTAYVDLATAATPVRLAIDVTLGVATATRNAELAAAITVAPNPASQRFTLSVPAGSLRTASASLANALGQIVATRQLSLPAAGGSAEFDVSRLATGIYTLTLQSGNDLVVKRVVVQ